MAIAAPILDAGEINFEVVISARAGYESTMRAVVFYISVVSRNLGYGIPAGVEGGADRFCLFRRTLEVMRWLTECNASVTKRRKMVFCFFFVCFNRTLSLTRMGDETIYIFNTTVSI